MRKAEEIIYNHYGCRAWEEVCKNFLTDISPSMIKEIVVQSQFEAFREGYYAGNAKCRAHKGSLIMEEIIKEDFEKLMI